MIAQEKKDTNMATPLNTSVASPEGSRLRTDTTPWYRQFWPWFLIAVPAVSVVASTAMLVIAIRNADEVVSAPGYELSRFAEERPARQAREKLEAERTAQRLHSLPVDPSKPRP